MFTPEQMFVVASYLHERNFLSENPSQSSWLMHESILEHILLVVFRDLNQKNYNDCEVTLYRIWRIAEEYFSMKEDAKRYHRVADQLAEFTTEEEAFMSRYKNRYQEPSPIATQIEYQYKCLRTLARTSIHIPNPFIGKDPAQVMERMLGNVDMVHYFDDGINLPSRDTILLSFCDKGWAEYEVGGMNGDTLVIKITEKGRSQLPRS